MKKLHLLGAAGLAAAGVAFAVKAARKKQNEPVAELDETKSASMKSASEDSALDTIGKPLDDAGTDDQMAVQIIRALRDRAFDGNDQKMALALGRTAEEVRMWFDGGVAVDGDALMKARAMGNQRNVDLPHEPV